MIDLEYLKVILSWPVITLVCFLYFIHEFNKDIKIFIVKLNELRYGDLSVKAKEQSPAISENKHEEKIESSMKADGINLTAGQIQKVKDEFNRLSEKTNIQESEIQEKDQLIKYAIERAKYFEFLYLDRFLVQNSKYALLWFYNQFNCRSTKENFKINFPLQSNIPDHNAEKDVILNVLLVNGLLLSVDKNPVLFKVSQKGEKFLKFVGLIK